MIDTTAAALAWLAHMPSCDCIGCLYVEAHLDDGDDDTAELRATRGGFDG